MSGKKISASFYQQRFRSKEEWRQLIEEILAKTGFKAKGKYFANVVYHRDKIGAVHLEGEYQGKPASLKIQGIDPGVSEAKNLLAFEKQNQSSLIRTPKIYDYQDYDQRLGFGYLIWEKVEGRFLREICQSHQEHLEKFSQFYQEFRAKALKEPWLEPKKKSILESAKEYCQVLEKIYQESGSKVLEEMGYDFRTFGKKFLDLVNRHQAVWTKEFTHGHLGPDDILIDDEGKFVIFSNLYWGWYPLYYDFVFYFWALSLSKEIKTAADLEQLYQLWLDGFREVKPEGFSQVAFKLVVLERLLGSILVQLSVTVARPTPQLRAAILFFNQLAGEI